MEMLLRVVMWRSVWRGVVDRIGLVVEIGLVGQIGLATQVCFNPAWDRISFVAQIGLLEKIGVMGRIGLAKCWSCGDRFGVRVM